MDLHQYFELVGVPKFKLTEEERASVVYARAELARRRAESEGEPQPTGRAANWCRMAARVLQVGKDLGRLPQPNDGVPRDLLYWVIRQRRASSRLNGFQTAFLEVIPGWSWSPLDDEWDLHAQELAAFITREERVPRRRAEDANERSLARWTSRQRSADARNELPYARSTVFRALFERR